MITFEESGMLFTFADEDCFRIEKDEIATLPCVKSCECVAMVHGKVKHIAFIEAKSSAPRSGTERQKEIVEAMPELPETWKLMTNFDTYVKDICQKFENSFSAAMAMQHGFHGEDAKMRIPERLRCVANDNIRFILILGNKFKDEWLPPLNDAVHECLRPFLKSWNIKDINVKTLNCDLAVAAGIPVKPL